MRLIRRISFRKYLIRENPCPAPCKVRGECNLWFPILILILLFLSQSTLAQNLLSPNLIPKTPEEIILGQVPWSPFNHPEIKWYVMETPHFLIYFDKKKHTEIAKDVARIAEGCYGTDYQETGP